MNDTTPTIAYEAPATASLSVFAALPLTIALAIFAAIVTAMVLVALPWSENLLRDFKIEPPAITHWLAAFARLGGGMVWPMVWILPVLPIPTLALLGSTPDIASRRRGLKRWRLLVTLLTLALVAAVAVAVLLPYVTLLDTVGGKGAGR